MEERIGVNIKRLRIQNRLTQQQVADMCNLSKGMISKIESGRVMPAIATLTRIAHALNVKVSLLMEEGNGRNAVCQPTTLSVEEFTKTDLGYRFLTLAAEYGDKQIQPLVFYARNGEVTSHRVSHQGEECIYIIEGEMSFLVGDTLYYLRKGDFLYFDGLQPHGIDSVEHEVRYLNLFSGSEYTSRVFGEK
jgi:transcriptional regulator with XRE-family HTH domain